MDKNPSNARELLAMRNRLQDALTPDEIRDVNWRALTDVAVNAIVRGWTGEELAHWALGDLGALTENIGATMLTTIRQLGAIDPPRHATPTPPPIQQVRADLFARHVPAGPAQASEWVTRIRAQLAERHTTPA